MRKISFEFLKTCVEIPTLLLFLSVTIAGTVTYNFVIFRSCYVDLGYNKSDCEKLGSGESDNYTRELEEIVQPHASVILMVQDLLTQGAPAFLCMFLGPWSDKHGRKPVLISTLLGFCLGTLVCVIVVLVESASAWWLLGTFLIVTIFGGASPFLTAVLSYISDITTEENRAMRMGIFESIMAIGALIGIVSTSYIFDLGGYLTVYILTVASIFLALLYNICVLKESLQYTQKKDLKLNIFSLKNLKDLLTTTFKNRKDYVRTMLILAMLMSTATRLISSVDSFVFYMFLRKKLNWDMEQYTLFMAFLELLRIVGMVAGVSLFHKVMKIRETPLILLAAVVKCFSMLFQAAATADWHIYLAGILKALSGFLAPMVRSLLSKLVAPDETGKVFSLAVAIESLSLMGGFPLHTLIYNATLSTNPGAFNFVTAGLCVILIVFAAMMLIVQKVLRKERTFTEKAGEVAAA